ncbi:MAG: histidine kinase [Solirubrobacteraceae bacterium]
MLAFSAFHALDELGRIAGASVGAGKVAAAAAMSVVFVSMHLRHLWFATHGRRPPHGAITLAVMACAELVGLVVIGVPWTGDLYALGVSALVVLAPPWSLGVVAACLLEPLLTGLHGMIFGSEVSTFPERLNTSYALLADVLSQFVIVWLIAAVYRLELSRGALAAAAAEQERQRVRARLQASLNHNLSGLLDAGRKAQVQIGRQGVAGALLALDGLIEFSQHALSDLRRVVADARTPAGSSAADGLIEAARIARTPIGRALSVGRARVACWALYVLWFAFVPLFVAGVFGPTGSHPSLPPFLAATIALGGLQTWLQVDVMRGRGPHFAAARWWLMLAIFAAVLPWGGYSWLSAGWFTAACAAISFTGWRRWLPVVAIAVAVAIADLFVQLPYMNAFNLFVEVAGMFVFSIFVSAALAASTWLVAAVRELEQVRGQLAEHAIREERRRMWSDLHDILGQSLTAISLKAGLARELVISGDRTAAHSEVTDVLALAEAQAAEIDQVAGNQRRVQLTTELDAAVALLRAAGIDVSTAIDLEELNDDVSTLLGWAIREGTTNILRHANARSCEIVLRRNDGRVQLQLRNDGARTPAPGGSGLAGLHERLALAQGSAQAEPLPGGRFQLHVQLPA